MKELRFFHGGVRLMSAAGFRAAVALSVVVGGGCAVLGKDVTLTFKAAGTMAEQGVWTVDGQPGAQADLAEGDTLVVKTGSLNGVYVKFDNFTTPRLAAFRCEGTGAVNFCALKLNLQDNGVLDVAQERMILSDGFFLNPGDGEDAMKMVVRTGAGTLQIRVAQPGCFKFRLSAGCNLYLHNDAALGPAYSTTVADALVLEDGASLRNGVANTADRDVTLPSSHGVTIVDGATVSFEAVRGETAASVWSLAVAVPRVFPRWVAPDAGLGAAPVRRRHPRLPVDASRRAGRRHALERGEPRPVPTQVPDGRRAPLRRRRHAARGAGGRQRARDADVWRGAGLLRRGRVHADGFRAVRREVMPIRPETAAPLQGPLGSRENATFLSTGLFAQAARGVA